jgi:hypothetical protein
MSSIRPEDIDEVVTNFHSIIEDFVDATRTNLAGLTPRGQWEQGTRIDVLATLSDQGPPTGDWQRLIWLSRVFLCISSSQLLQDKATLFPSKKLPNSDEWNAGILQYTIRGNPSVPFVTIWQSISRE